MKAQGKRKVAVAPAQPEPEPRDGQTSMAVRQCGTPGCSLFDFHVGLCNSVELGSKRVRRMPLWMVQEYDNEHVAEVGTNDDDGEASEGQQCVPCWVARAGDEDSVEAETVEIFGVAAEAKPQTEARRSAHPAANASNALPNATVRTAPQPGQQGPSSGGYKPCEHGLERYRCKECSEAGLCKHGWQRSLCMECGGGSICEHGRKFRCKECGGAGICEHGRQRSRCNE